MKSWMRGRAVFGALVALSLAFVVEGSGAQTPAPPRPIDPEAARDVQQPPRLEQGVSNPGWTPAERASLVAPDRQCVSPRDRSTSAVLSLHQYMILLAVKCHREQDYDVDFVARFQPVLRANDAIVTAWFSTVFGQTGVGERDTFTNELVNEMAKVAHRDGQAFCEAAGRFIDGLRNLPSIDALADYAVSHDMAAVEMNMCAWSTRRP